MKAHYILLGIFLLLIIFVMTSCAPAGSTPNEYGFFSGFIHGLICIPAIAMKLLSSWGIATGVNFGYYAVHNSGFLYWFGYVIGVVLSLIIGGTGGIIGIASSDKKR